MSNPIKASPTVFRDLSTDKEITATAASGNKYALDVNIAAGTLEVTSTEGSTVDHARHDHTTPVTTAAYTTLIASTAADATSMSLFDSSGESLILAIGAAASEVDKLYIFPGGNNAHESLMIPAGSRISVKAVSGNTAVGELLINLIG